MAGAVREFGKVVVKGQTDIERAFLQLRKEVLVGLKPAILEVANTVRVEAEQQAVSQIENIGPRWSQMRIGVTPKLAYVAPRARRRGGSPRPNLGGLLFTVMSTAADRHQDELFARLDELVTISAASSGLL